MSAEARLAEIVSALESVGLSCLVLGGHAARYYGVNRTTNALAQLRSRSGFEAQQQQGHLNDPAAIRQALALTRLSITQAYLLPLAPDTSDLTVTRAPVEPVILNRLRTVSPGSTLHLALVEAVRRQYKLVCQAEDRADKQAIRAAQGHPPSPPP